MKRKDTTGLLERNQTRTKKDQKDSQQPQPLKAQEKLDAKKERLYDKVSLLSKYLGTRTLPSYADVIEIKELLDLTSFDFMTPAEQYVHFREQFIMLVNLCMDFDGHEIKAAAFNFLTVVARDLKKIEPSNLSFMVEGGYLSLKTYQFLKEFYPQIQAEQNGFHILYKLKKMLSSGQSSKLVGQGDGKFKVETFAVKPEKMDKIKELIELYSAPLPSPETEKKEDPTQISAQSFEEAAASLGIES